jgi:hypothetical protein
MTLFPFRTRHEPGRGGGQAGTGEEVVDTPVASGSSANHGCPRRRRRTPGGRPSTTGQPEVPGKAGAAPGPVSRRWSCALPAILGSHRPGQRGGRLQRRIACTTSVAVACDRYRWRPILRSGTWH